MSVSDGITRNFWRWVYRYNIQDDLILVANADWEDWSQFSKNRLEVSGGTLNPGVTLDRNFKDTWHVAMGLVRKRTDKDLQRRYFLRQFGGRR